MKGNERENVTFVVIYKVNSRTGKRRTKGWVYNRNNGLIDDRGESIRDRKVNYLLNDFISRPTIELFALYHHCGDLCK